MVNILCFSTFEIFSSQNPFQYHENADVTSTQHIEVLGHLSADCVTDLIVQGGRHSCAYCGKKFKRKEALVGHIREHQGLDVSKNEGSSFATGSAKDQNLVHSYPESSFYTALPM